MGMAGFVLGIISCCFGAFLTFKWIGLIIGIVGLILATIALKGEKNGINTAGFVLSIIGIGLCVVLWIACAACTACAMSNAAFY